MNDIVFIGTRRHALHGGGKVSRVFWDTALPVLKRYGFIPKTFENVDIFKASTDRWEKAVFILVHNEDDDEKTLKEIESVEQIIHARCREFLLIHRAAIARIVGSQATSNRLFSQHGIRVPQVFEGPNFQGDVFSDSPRGSSSLAKVYRAEDVREEEGRYNSQFIDTIYSFGEKRYYVCLRAMCVGGNCIAIYVKCRDVEENNPSVHAANTPLSPDLINALYASIVIPRQGSIIAACKAAGEVLGLGFYSHDFLPCARSGEVYLCEPGFKFDEFSLREQLAPISDKLVFPELFNGMETVRSTHVFVEEARKLGYLVEGHDRRALVATNDLTIDMPWIDRADADIDAFINSYTRPVTFDLAEKLHFWKTNGYVVFRNVVSHELIDQFISEVNHLREHFHDYTVPIEVRGQQTWSKAVSRQIIDDAGVKFNHLHVASLHAARLSLTREVTEFLEAIFGSAAVPMQSLTFWMGSQQPTHIDYPYVKMQRRLSYMAASWIPLEDVHADAGPLAYYPGAHRTDITRFFDWGEGSIVSGKETQTRNGKDFADYIDGRIRDAKIQAAIFLPKKGDALIWHSNMPHTGTPIKDKTRTRKSYVTHYTGLSDYPSSWIPDGEKWKSSVVREHRGVVMDFPWFKPEGKLPSWTTHFANPSFSDT